MISDRYVLTAAHCVRGLRRKTRLFGLRLGEYDTSKVNDCIGDPGSSDEFCADEPIDVKVEESIVHEGYSSAENGNDIALLRLNMSIPITDFVKPICLPRNHDLGQKLIVTGWGRTETGENSEISLKADLPLVEIDHCNITIFSLRRSIITHKQICAGSEQGKDSCKGDSGSPLMKFEKGRDGERKWTILGVVSYGPIPCGTVGQPGFYTRISEYVPWILSKVKP